MVPVEVVRQYKNNSIIVQSDKTPKEHGKAFIDQKEVIGRIKEIFGPKDNPYILIELEDKISSIEELTSKGRIYLED